MAPRGPYYRTEPEPGIATAWINPWVIQIVFISAAILLAFI